MYDNVGCGVGKFNQLFNKLVPSSKMIPVAVGGMKYAVTG
jgi:hypothetical protein